jgi:putative DNA primase/helicase
VATRSDLLEEALRYAALGWEVFPLAARSKVPKRGSRGLLDATSDPETVRAWWSEDPHANIGLNVGRSGLVCVDIDPRHDGDKTWTELVSELGEDVSRTVSSATGGGGRHFLYRRNGKPVRSVDGALGPGVDTKSEGGYIVLPPSVHPSGRPYAWVPGASPFETTPAPLPKSLEVLCPEAVDPKKATESGPSDQTRPKATTGKVIVREDEDEESWENEDTYWLRAAIRRAGPGTRNNTGFWLACQLRDAGLDEGTATAVMEAYTERVHGLGPDPYTYREAYASLEEAYSRPAREEAKDPTRTAGGGPVPLCDPETGEVYGDVAPETLNALHLTDSGNAEAMALLYGDRLRFAHLPPKTRDISGFWLVWSGHRWSPNATGDVDRFALSTVRARLNAARVLPGEDGPSKEAKWALGSESARRRRDLVALARAERPIATRFEEFDRDPWLMGTENGVLDLRTGDLRPGRPSDMLTKSVGYAFDQSARCPRWLRFLDEVFGGDTDLIGFVQRSVGYSLTGDTREQCLFLCHGKGANGKSTMLGTLRAVLGDYSANTPFSTFEVGDRSGNTNDLAALAGTRLVTAAETSEARRLNEARVKAVTGGDPVTARFLYTEFFEYVPTYKIWLSMNALPTVAGVDEGIWRRLRLIPFRVSFKGREDRTLEATLRAEAPGILAWAVDGCLQWQAMGDLGAPSAVLDATEAYRAESDVIGRFLEDRTASDPDPRHGVRASDLYSAYSRWCLVMGEKAETATTFGRRLGDLGFEKKRAGAGMFYYGLRLVDAEDPDEDEK